MVPALKFSGESIVSAMSARWKTIVQLDGAHRPFLVLEGPVGEQAYEDAGEMAERIREEGKDG